MDNIGTLYYEGVEEVDRIKVINNNCRVKHVSDSVGDLIRNSKLPSSIKIMRNDANRLRELSIGRVEALPSSPCLSTGISNQLRIELSGLSLGDYIMYDSRSRLFKFVVNDESESTYYLIRVPDIVCKLEDFREEDYF